MIQRSIGAAMIVTMGVAHSAMGQGEPFFERISTRTTNTAIVALSADGSVGFGYSTLAEGRIPVRWTRQTGVVPMVMPSWMIQMSSPRAYVSWNGDTLSMTGTVRSGPYEGQRALRWTTTDGFAILEVISGGVQSLEAAGISGTGHAIYFRSRAGETQPGGTALWTNESGGVNLDSAASGIQVVGTNFDGSVAVGARLNGAGLAPVRWSPRFGVQVIGNLPGGNVGSAYACSADGSSVVGISTEAGGGSRGFLWREADGFVPLALVWGSRASVATGISADGRVIVGAVGSTAAIWNSPGSGRYLHELLREQLGFDPGYLFWNSICISADGKTIGGYGFVARLRAPCAGDVDDGTMSGGRDGGVGPDDLTAFLTWMGEGNMLADLDDGSATGRPDASITIDDLLYFLRGYVDGC